MNLVVGMAAGLQVLDLDFVEELAALGDSSDEGARRGMIGLRLGLGSQDEGSEGDGISSGGLHGGT